MKCLRHLLCGAAALALNAAPLAVAQPTGNPKGTPPPLSTDAQKAPAGGASRAPTAQPDSGKLYTDKGPAEARTHTNHGPGTGTTGGLQKKTPRDGA
ncbi:MAG: hypothetical protein EOO24_21490, partial [Comamonadaceae bacterium]